MSGRDLTGGGRDALIGPPEGGRIFEQAARAGFADCAPSGRTRLDTLARCMAGGDESKTADMSRVVEACDLIRVKTGAALLIIHHTGKVEEQAGHVASGSREAFD